jgi:hypothetical protein
LTTNSASDHARTPAKKNALEMMPVAITNAKQPESSVAISAPSHEASAPKAREALPLRESWGAAHRGDLSLGLPVSVSTSHPEERA